MKRIISVILILAMCTALIGCGETAETPASSAVSEKPEVSDAPAGSAEVSTGSDASAESAEVPTSSTVSEKALELASAMPAASFEALPDWRGYTVTDRYWTEYYNVPAYEREEIDILAELGFNFIRTQMHLESIFTDGDPDRINTDFLERMDRLLEYCAEDGIHVCFNLHDMPGFRTNDDSAPNTLFTDEETQELFVEFWRFLADWYSDVPSSLLSFNLLNEPHLPEGGTVTDEEYSTLMLRAIDAIRESSPDRLIFVDMLDIPMGTPVYGLAEAQIVQTAHPYFLPDETRRWPFYYINGFVHQDSGVLSLQGDFRAGTELTFAFDSVHMASTFSAAADGKTVASMKLGEDAVDENGCIEIGEEGTEGEWRRYEDASFSITLAEDCSVVELRQDGGVWYQLKGITILADHYEAELVSDAMMVPDESTPAFTLDGDGTVTAEKDGTLVNMPLWLDELCRSYQAFTQETGTLVMIQEFGFNNTLPHNVILDAAEDLLSLLDKYDFSWCSWNGDFGPLIDARDNATASEEFLHTDVTYEELSPNWLLDRELAEVFQRHMGK